MALELNAPSPNAGGVDTPSAGAAAKDTLSSILSFTQGLIPLVVAIFLWYFGSTLKKMFGLTSPNINEIEWGRNVYLYSGLEALAYAAAGFLFGREVNRQRAERAEENADKAQKDASAANKDASAAHRAAADSAAGGKALAEGVRALDEAQSAGAADFAADRLAPRQPDVRALRRIADSFFPVR
jgi:hypothetical protein